jgi:hypothetical protein
MTLLIAAAYAAAPRDLAADTRAEAEWYDMLSAEPRIDGLELAFTEGLHPSGNKHLSGLLRDDWAYVVTNVRRTMGASHRLATYGLASDDPEGRTAAIEDVRLLREQVRELERPVVAVELHSAPSRGRSSAGAESLARSLDQIVQWDWDGAQIVVEHCDAYRNADTIQKGYLPLRDELDALDLMQAHESGDVAIALNWGRSSIESGDAEGPKRHVRETLEHASLAGYFFSGAASRASSYGEAWRDVHLPMQADEPSSLLTAARIERIVSLLPSDITYVGAKVASHPEASGLDCFRETRSLLAVLHQALASSSPTALTAFES